MIEREYATNNTHAQQILSVVIHAAPETVYHYLSTTECISSWIPELSFNEDKEVLFDMGDGTYERMNILFISPTFCNYYSPVCDLSDY